MLLIKFIENISYCLIKHYFFKYNVGNIADKKFDKRHQERENVIIRETHLSYKIFVTEK